MNQKIFEILFGLSHASALLDAVFVFLAKFLPYILILGFLVIVFYFYRANFRWRLLFFIEAALALILGSGFIVQFFRYFYYHPRPHEVFGLTPLIAPSHGSSFPSNHATILFALSLLVFYLNRRAGFWFFALSSLVSLARVIVGVHWPLDILGGAIAGLLTAFIVHGWLASLRRQV